jgi:hypothetical protein
MDAALEYRPVSMQILKKRHTSCKSDPILQHDEESLSTLDGRCKTSALARKVPAFDQWVKSEA